MTIPMQSHDGSAPVGPAPAQSRSRQPDGREDARSTVLGATRWRGVLAATLALLIAAASAGPSLAQTPPPPVPQDAPAATSPTPPAQAPPPTEPPTDDATATSAPDQRPDARPPDAAERFRCSSWPHRPVFKLGQDHHVRATDVVRDVVVVFGALRVEGEVCGDLVAVFGNVDLGPTAYVRDALTVVGGRLTAATGAEVDGDLVVVGGAMDVPTSFEPGREQVFVGLPIVGDRLLGIVPWLTRGLLYGRLIVPDLAWNWYVVAITLFVVLVINLLFPRASTLSTAVIQAKPLSTFAAGLLVLLLSGPVMTLLAVTVIGVAVVPFVMLAMFAAWLVGSIAVARWIGASLVAQDEPEARGASTRSLLIGFVVKVIAYMIPLVGLTVWALAGVLGLGAATLAFIGAFRAENPRPTPPVPPVRPSPRGDASSLAGAGAGGVGYAGMPDVEGPPPPPSPPSSATNATGTDLRQFPRGAFLERLGALVLDVVLVGIVNGLLDLTDREGAFFFLLLIYHVIFWAWKGTTIGGMISQLRVVRMDGQALTVGDAFVRGLTGVLSIGALGLGFFWILRDEQRLSWHDIVAGTLVVRVPRGWPLP